MIDIDMGVRFAMFPLCNQTFQMLLLRKTKQMTGFKRRWSPFTKKAATWRSFSKNSKEPAIIPFWPRTRNPK